MSKGFHRLPSSTPWSNKAAPQLSLDTYEQPWTQGVTIPDEPERAITTTDPATFEPGPAEAPVTKDAARASGYTGDQCSNCSSMRMRIAGHCLCCDDCGTTTGCS